MCIIVVKKAGIDMPEMDILQRCFESNRDGAGFMWADGKKVIIRKGFMTFADFASAIDAEIPEPMRKHTSIVMHFRIATHGKVKPETCHPFPVDDEPDKLRETEAECRFGLAHNGVIPGRTTNDTWSDTMDFTAGVVAPLARMNPNFIHSSDAMELLESACGSKLAIMDGAGDIVTVGQFTEDDGVLYSNTSYLRFVKSWTSYGSLWSDSYYEAYPQYRDFDPYWEDDLLDLIDQLPFAACQTCLMCEECALNFPECETEKMATETADLLDEMEEEQKLELTFG